MEVEMEPRQLRSASRRTGSICPLWMAAALVAWLGLCAGAEAQLAPNQTHGFGNGNLITFTYLQNFDCVDQPDLNLDFNGKLAQSDPAEMQLPICQAVT